jgi:16S rRNA C967 or C1407 C5-methylase (RsmB/RsmF family)/NOL1/NOP2/fmu family ribosome biogenesis protein
MTDFHFPPAFESRMRSQLQGEWSAFAEAHNHPSPTSIRINSRKQYDSPSQESVTWSQLGKYLSERPQFTLDPFFHAGCYYVQEASSMFLEQAVKQSIDLSKQLRVLDLCAAPGGKSTHLLSLLNDQSFLVTNEVIRSRASILSENVQKWGHPNVVVTNSDPEHFKELTEVFDLVVVDAPCSGEGLFRKEPEAMNEWSEDNVVLCSSRQKRILSHIWATIKEDGVLIYCTCTYNEFENEQNLAWLREQHDVEFIKLTIDPSWNIETVTNNDATGYHFYPHKTNGEGFFISVIRKRESSGELRLRTDLKIFTRPQKKIAEQATDWITNADHLSIIQFKDSLVFTSTPHVSFIEVLTKHLHIVHSGTALGTLKHDKIVPEHASALSINLNKENFQHMEVSLEEALMYLRKDNLPVTGLQRGFTLVTYHGVPLGWINVLDNRSNNLYPANWRVRMQTGR